MTLIGGQVAGRDAGAAGGVVVLEHPVQGRVGADDEEHRAGRDRDQLGAGGGALERARRRTAWSGGRRRCRSRGCRGRRPERVSVSTESGTFCTEQATSNGSHSGLEVGDDGAGAVGLLEVGVGRVDAGVDDRDRDALAGQRACRPRRSGSGWPRGRGWPCWRSPGRARSAACRPRRTSRRAGCAPPGSAPWCRRAPTTPILRKVVDVSMPVAATAALAACRFSPWTSTSVVPVRLVSCLLRYGDTSASCGAGTRRGRGGQAGRGDDCRRADGQGCGDAQAHVVSSSRGPLRAGAGISGLSESGPVRLLNERNVRQVTPAGPPSRRTPGTGSMGP